MICLDFIPTPTGPIFMVRPSGSEDWEREIRVSKVFNQVGWGVEGEDMVGDTGLRVLREGEGRRGGGGEVLWAVGTGGVG